MVNGLSASKSAKTNRKWTHTRKNPTATKTNGKWRLGANFYAKLTSKKGKIKYTTDIFFASDFGSPGCKNGRYDTKEGAEKDTGNFRSALEFGDYRPGRGGGNNTDQPFSSSTRYSPRVTNAEQHDQDNIIKHVLDSLISRVEKNVRIESVMAATIKREDGWTLFSAQKPRTAAFVRLRRFKATRLRLFSNANKARLKMGSKIRNEVAQLEWYDWRVKVIAHICKFINANCVWKLINAKFESADKISAHQLVLVQRKAQAVMHFMILMNERVVGAETDPDSSVKAAELAVVVGKYTGCSAASVYNYYLEYKVCNCLLSLVSTATACM